MCMSKMALCFALVAALSFVSCRTHDPRTSRLGVDPLNGAPSGVDDRTTAGEDSKLNVIPSVTISPDDLSDDSGILKPIFFNYDQYDIRDDQMPALEQDAGALVAKAASVVIQGHCDERGTEEYNLALGDRRARAVRDYLITLGVSGEKLTTISFGEFQPFANGHSEEAWQQNRRAQFAEIPHN